MAAVLFNKMSRRDEVKQELVGGSGYVNVCVFG